MNAVLRPMTREGCRDWHSMKNSYAALSISSTTAVFNRVTFSGGIWRLAT